MSDKKECPECPESKLITSKLIIVISNDSLENITESVEDLIENDDFRGNWRDGENDDDFDDDFYDDVIINKPDDEYQ
jgi:hypothetical protein